VKNQGRENSTESLVAMESIPENEKEENYSNQQFE